MPHRPSLALTLLTLLSLCAACGEDPRVEQVLALEGDASQGASTFSRLCASCHGAGGRGGRGPDLRDANDPAEAVDTILNGGFGMSGFGDQLSDQQIADLLAHIDTI